MISLIRYAKAQSLIDDIELSLIDLYQQRECAILETGGVDKYERLVNLINTIYKIDRQIDKHKEFIRILKKEINEK